MRWGTISISKVDSLFLSLHQVGLDDIIEIIPIKDRFLRRLSGDLNIGFNYTKSSNILQFNLITPLCIGFLNLNLG